MRTTHLVKRAVLAINREPAEANTLRCAFGFGPTGFLNEASLGFRARNWLPNSKTLLDSFKDIENTHDDTSCRGEL